MYSSGVMRFRLLLSIPFWEFFFLSSSSWGKYFWSVMTVEGILLCLIKFLPQLYQHFSLPFLVVSTQGNDPPPVVQPTSNGVPFPSILLSDWRRSGGLRAMVSFTPGVLATVWQLLGNANREFAFVASNERVANDSPSRRTSMMRGLYIFCRGIGILLSLSSRQLASAARQSTVFALLSSSSSSSLSSAGFFSRFFGLLSPQSLLSCGLLGMIPYFFSCLPLPRDIWDAGITLNFVRDAFPNVMFSYPTTATLVSLFSAAAVKRLLIFVTQMRLSHRPSFSSTLFDDRWTDGDAEVGGEKGRGKKVLQLLKEIFLRACTLRHDTLDYAIFALTNTLWMEAEKGRGVTSSSPPPLHSPSSVAADTSRGTPSATPATEWLSSSRTTMTREESPVQEVGRVSSAPLSPSSTASYAVLAFTNGIFDGFMDALVGFSLVVDPSCCWDSGGSQTLFSRLSRLVHFYASVRFSRLLTGITSFEADMEDGVQRFLSIPLAHVLGTPRSERPTFPACATLSHHAAGDEPCEAVPAASNALEGTSSSSLPLPSRGEGGSSGSAAYLVPVPMEYFLSWFNRLTFMAAGVASGYAFLGSRVLVIRALECLIGNEKIEMALKHVGICPPVRIPERFSELPVSQVKKELDLKIVDMKCFLIFAEGAGHATKILWPTQWGTRRKIKRTQKLLNLLDGLSAEDVEDCMCPITLCLMENPVSTSDGHTYDEKAITEWLRTHQTSPLTNVSLKNSCLRPNMKVKMRVRQLVKALCFTP